MKWTEELACLLLELVKSLGLRYCIVETYFRQTISLEKAIRNNEHLCWCSTYLGLCFASTGHDISNTLARRRLPLDLLENVGLDNLFSGELPLFD